MNILFVFGHPADVHFFRNAMSELSARGHRVDIAAVPKEIVQKLLKLYGLRYYTIGANTPTVLGKALTLAAKDVRLVHKASATRPDIIVSFGSPYAAHASAVLGVPHVAFTDTEIAHLSMKIMLPFTDVVCTPSCFGLNLGPKQVRFAGYKELAYLHPNRFRPNPGILDRAGVGSDDKIIVVRLGTIASSHDLDRHGLELRTAGERLSFVQALEEYGKVFVTSEMRLEPELQRRALPIPVTEIHSLLYFASLYIGDGVTMANECGVLGTPWIYVSNRINGVNADQEERYSLGFREESTQRALSRAASLLQQSTLKSVWQIRRQRMLADMIDVTEFIVDLVENWPDSFVRPSPLAR